MLLFRKGIIGLLLLVMVGCSPAMLSGVGSMLGLGGDKSGLSVDARIAKEANDSIVIGENDRTDIKAHTVAITEIVQKNFSWGLLIFAIVGWILPTPSRMAKSLWKNMTSLWKRRVKTPEERKKI